MRLANQTYQHLETITITTTSIMDSTATSEHSSPIPFLPQIIILPQTYVSNSFLEVFVWVDYVILVGIICFSGVIFNVINIIIFYRLGFNDTVNISLFSLAITDLGSLLPFLWKSILFNPAFHNSNLITFDYVSFQYYTAGWVHGCFNNIGCLIMLFVTLDRCLCIAMPLKVKLIITPKRTTIIIFTFFFVFLLTRIPLYSTLKIGSVFFENRNKTLTAFIPTDAHHFALDTIFFMHFANQIVSASAITVFTIVLVVHLVRQSKWRMKTLNNSSNSSANTNVRDMKTVKLILFIALFFLTANIPKCSVIMAMVFKEDFNFTGRYKNLCTVVWGIANIFCASNSTINIFVYVNMSTKYSNMFYNTFKCLKPGKTLQME